MEDRAVFPERFWWASFRGSGHVRNDATGQGCLSINEDNPALKLTLKTLK